MESHSVTDLSLQNVASQQTNKGFCVEDEHVFFKMLMITKIKTCQIHFQQSIDSIELNLDFSMKWETL